MTDISVVLVDWAGTVTVPMNEMMKLAIDHLDMSDEQLSAALGGLSDYFTGSDSIVHRAERGEIADAELLAWLEQQSPGASRLFDTDGPSFINAPDRPEMIELLWWLQDVDVTVMLATNNFLSAQEMLASRYLDSGLVHAIVNSALIGARKPDPEFWDVVLDATMVEPHEIVLLDDNDHNLRAAEALGMQTIAVGDDAASAVAELKALLGSAP